MDSKLQKKIAPKKMVVHQCFCGEPIREFTIKKEGPRKGEKMESCGTALWNPETKQQYGGCSYLKFQGDVYMICETCSRPMKTYKNIISSALCVNTQCPEFRTEAKNESKIAKARRWFPRCGCGEEFAASVRGKNVSLFCKQKLCKETHGLGISDEDGVAIDVYY